MPRKPRVVAVGVPHHITQRGNDRQDVFFHPRDREAFLNTFFEHAVQYHLRVWGYCLMSNHVHFIVLPEQPSSLARVIGRTDSDYARYANLLRRGCGHLWQARFYSCPLDGPSAWRALAYVERNPVRAGLVGAAEEYPWSSARVHCGDVDRFGRLDLSAWSEVYTADRWTEVLRAAVEEAEFPERLRRATSLGLPLGTEAFVERMGAAAGRDLRPRAPGRPPKLAAAAAAATGNTLPRQMSFDEPGEKG